MASAATLSGRFHSLRAGRGVERFAWVVVGLNTLNVLWGALVRVTGSGAGCGNHWPLCNGEVIPLSPAFHTVIEFTHRMLVFGLVWALFALLAWIFWATPRGSAARVFAVLATLLTLNEAFIGALLVKLGYVTDNRSVGRVVVLAIHLTNTLLMLAALTLTARMLRTRQHWAELRAPGTGSGGRADRAAAIFSLAATLLVGVSGSLAALGDTLFPASTLRGAFAADFSAGSPWLLRLRGVHPASALVAAGCALWLVLRARRHGGGSASRAVVGLLVLQMVLGVADVLLLAPTWMQIAHLLGADLYWIALVVLAARVAWPADHPSSVNERWPG